MKNFKIILSPRFPNFLITKQLRSTLVSMSKEKNFVTGKMANTTAIYRLLLKSDFNDLALGNGNADHLKQNHPILDAFKGNLTKLKNSFNYLKFILIHFKFQIL